MVALAADVAAHFWLAELCLYDACQGDPAALDAVVDAALARRLSALKLMHCCLSPESVPALVRLLAGDTLTELSMVSGGALLLDEPAATLLGDVLRTNTSLTALRLSRWRLWNNPAAAVVFCAALAGHPRLHTIDLSDNHMHGIEETSASLGALVAANAPALQQLDISISRLGDAGMGPLVDALRQNTHLRVLNCAVNEMSEAFARDRLLPAVRANTSLRKLTVLHAGSTQYVPWSAREAAALVAVRTQQPLA